MSAAIDTDRRDDAAIRLSECTEGWEEMTWQEKREAVDEYIAAIDDAACGD